jgi:hypothetical protein
MFEIGIYVNEHNIQKNVLRYVEENEQHCAYIIMYFKSKNPNHLYTVKIFVKFCA